jgi:hypothetical protein
MICYYIGDPMDLGGCDVVCAIACAAPPPVQTPPGWVSSIDSYGCMSGQGSASNPNNIIGASNDGQYATIYGGNLGDAGYIMAYLNSYGAYYGKIYLYGYSAYGYSSHIYVYVWYNGQWRAINDVTVDYSQGVHSIYIGEYIFQFNYMCIVGYDDYGASCNFKLDAVAVDY